MEIKKLLKLLRANKKKISDLRFEEQKEIILKMKTEMQRILSPDRYKRYKALLKNLEDLNVRSYQQKIVAELANYLQAYLDEKETDPFND